jgi:hypothetical protein
MGSRSRLRPGASVSSKTSISFERYNATRGSRFRVMPAAFKVAQVRSMKASKGPERVPRALHDNV